MVKTPQTQLGYFVDGVMVFKPVKRLEGDCQEEQCNKSDKNRGKKRGIRSASRLTSGSGGSGCVSTTPPLAMVYKSIRREEDMVDLKNACKQRKSLTTILDIASRVARKYFRSNPRNSKIMTANNLDVLDVLRVLFCKDLEGRCALYYAAHSGHADLVYTILGLYIICRLAVLKPIVVMTIGLDTKLTMKEWIGRIGYPCTAFAKLQYETCVLNALSDEVRQVMHSSKFTIREIHRSLIQKRLLHDLVSNNSSSRLSTSSSDSFFSSEDEYARRLQGLLAMSQKRRPKLVWESAEDLFFLGGITENDDDDDGSEDENDLADGEEHVDHQKAPTIRDDFWRTTSVGTSAIDFDLGDLESLSISLALAASLEEQQIYNMATANAGELAPGTIAAPVVHDPTSEEAWSDVGDQTVTGGIGGEEKGSADGVVVVIVDEEEEEEWSHVSDGTREVNQILLSGPLELRGFAQRAGDHESDDLHDPDCESSSSAWTWAASMNCHERNSSAIASDPDVVDANNATTHRTTVVPDTWSVVSSSSSMTAFASLMDSTVGEEGGNGNGKNVDGGGDISTKRANASSSQISFKDALLKSIDEEGRKTSMDGDCKPSEAGRRHLTGTKKPLSLSQSHNPPFEEEPSDRLCRSDFDWECAKTQSGGKVSQRFRGNVRSWPPSLGRANRRRWRMLQEDRKQSSGEFKHYGGCYA